ncbi:MAG: nitrilase-related carbon-nitrogen hydrolase [Rhodospirillaceae bacterium]|nr:nitrilase-related carbon-nitrogen hydrolase [Rhodospirillaceae bacterium]
MILMQTPWTPSTAAKELSGTIGQALETVIDPKGMLVLLPHGDGGPDQAVSEVDAVAALAELAKEYSILLCGSAYVVDGEGCTRTVGYLVNPSGELLLRMPKIMPDLIEGFTDTVSDASQPADFPVALTPEGQVGILCGEDVLSPHIVRSLITSGAEVILNPSRERTDRLFDIRQKARQARSYENLAYVASASASSVTINGVTSRLPTATSLAEMWGTELRASSDESFVVGDIDIESLRRRREEPMGNLPAIVRMRLYADGYAKEASNSPSSPASREEWIAVGQEKVAASAKLARSEDDRMDRYDAVLGQTVTRVALKPAHLSECRQENLDNALYVVGPFARSPGVKLVVFPEFFLTGAVSQLGSSSGHIASEIGISFPGPEADQLAKFAQDNNTFVSGGVFEFDPAWPDRFFNSAFIFDDNGNLIHLYRKIHCADVFGRLPDTTPGSVYTEYVDRYGYDHLFPVADTPLGKLCTVICFDMNFGETHRAMVKRGAEVIIHPTSEPHNVRRRGWDIARHVRAFENTSYLLTAGHGGEFRGEGLSFPGAMQRGYSKVVNYDGSLQCIVDGPGAVPLVGSLDMTALRRARAGIKGNLAAWDDPVVYAHKYAADRGIRNDAWAGDPMVNPYEDAAEIKKVIHTYQRNNVYIRAKGAGNKPAIDQSMQAVV